MEVGDTEPNRTGGLVRRPDSGSTLIEIIISVVLMGTVVAALVAAVLTMIGASSTVFEAARVETVLLNAADQIDRARQQCDYTEYVEAAATAQGWQPEQIRVDGELLQSNTGDESIDWSVPDCSVTDVKAFDVQRLTITATDPSGSITRTLMVVKSSVG